MERIVPILYMIFVGIGADGGVVVEGGELVEVVLIV
jgi:hypothetical protein